MILQQLLLLGNTVPYIGLSSMLVSMHLCSDVLAITDHVVCVTRGIRWGVVAFTIAIFMVAVWAVPGFLTNTEISQTPPKGSAAYT